jgi:methyl halide transferase
MDWESRYRIGDTPWEKGAPAPPLLEWFRIRGALDGAVLVPGCGTGHNVRAITDASPAAEVLGLDIAPSAVERARRFRSAGNEKYRLGNLFDLPADLVNRFDWVFEHTCFCAIDPKRRIDYVQGVARALSGKGRLLAVFYLNPWDPGEAPDQGGPPFGTTREELDALFGNDFVLVEELRPSSAYPGREGREIVRLLRLRAQHLSAM